MDIRKTSQRTREQRTSQREMELPRLVSKQEAGVSRDRDIFDK